MIFQPGAGGSGGGLTAKTGIFATSNANKTISLGFKAKVCIVIYEKSARNAGFLLAGGSTRISAESETVASNVYLSSDGMTLSSDFRSIDNGIRYLALG